MDNVISRHVYYYMYMYLKSLNVVFLQPIFTDTNLTESKFIFIDIFCSTDKKGEKLYRMLY